MQEWSFKIKILFPTTRKKEIEVTVRPTTLKFFIGISGVVLLFFLFAGLRYSFFEVDYHRLRALELENKELKSEIEHMKKASKALDKKYKQLFEQNNRLRVAVGLDPVPREFAYMGIGGNLEEIPIEGKQDVKYVKQELDRLLNLAKFQLESFSEVEKKFEEDQHVREHTPSIVPCAGYFTSGFGLRRDPFTGQIAFHEAIDISAPAGTPVVAPAAGIVRSVKWEQGYGLMVEIDHGMGITTRYAHLMRSRVSPGQYVKRGDIIAYVGSSGRSTAPHLHYEVRVNNKPVNPINYIIPAGVYYD